MTRATMAGYVLLPRPLQFDRRALIHARALPWMPLEVERQLNAIERRQRLGSELRSPAARYAPYLTRRRPPG
jgi:hypothetical protein